MWSLPQVYMSAAASASSTYRDGVQVDDTEERIVLVLIRYPLPNSLSINRIEPNTHSEIHRLT